MDRLDSGRWNVGMNTHQSHSTTTLVLGGTGRTGRRVIDRLRVRGVPTRVGSRRGDPPFQWHDATTWDGVLDGVSAVYLCYHPDLAVPGAADTVGAFARSAVAAGVSRMVLLAGRGEEEAERAEELVRAGARGSGTTVTVVRASWFAQNFSEGFFRDELLTGELALPVRDVLEPFVDIDDVAEVVTEALTDDRHAGQVYDVTGPRLLTFAQAVAEIAAATGIPARTRAIALDEYTAAMAADGAPPEVTQLMAYLFTDVLDGRNAVVGDGIERALGRPARDFRDFARLAAASGAWDKPPAVLP